MNSNKRTLAVASLLAAASLVLGGCAGVAFGDGSPADGNTGRRAEEVMAPRHTSAHIAAHVAAPIAAAPPMAASAPAPGTASRNTVALREAIKLYDDGEFNGAIRRFGSVDIAGEAVDNRLLALKYTAFSYCVTARPGPCRLAFDKALRLDPSFDLTPGESRHPLWGPVFAKAKKAD